MEEATTGIRRMAETFKEYMNTRVDIVKLKAAEKISLVISTLIARAIVVVVFFMFLVFISIAGALALSGWIGKPWMGFFIMSGIYLLAGWGAWLSKERFIRIPIMNNIIHQLFKEEEDAGEKD